MRAQATGVAPMSRAPVDSVLRGEGAVCSDPGWVSLTRHTWRLSTSSFDLDFTWSRQEGRTAPSSASPIQAASAPGQTRKAQPRPAQSFAEVLRRQQLAALIMMPSLPPPDRTPLSRTDQRAPALPGQVCRAYAEALGPLAAPASRCFMA